MAISIDDSQLLRLAADPRTRLFPTLRGSTVFWPIVLLVSWLPCIAAAIRPEFPDESAGWALRALDVSPAGSSREWLQPGLNGLGAALIDQPPLSTWILALFIPHLGTQNLCNWLVPSLLAAFGTIYVAYLLGRRIGGSAFGLMTAVVICAHPVVLNFATDTGPAAVGTLLIALTAWGFLGHLEGPLQLVSARLLAGAVSWGLAILAVVTRACTVLHHQPRP